MTFDALGYLASYPDLAALGIDASTAARHFIEFGAMQGRVANGLTSGPSWPVDPIAA